MTSLEIEPRTPVLRPLFSNHCTNINSLQQPLLYLLHLIQRKKILKHISNKEPGRKEAHEERDEVAMALLS